LILTHRLPWCHSYRPGTISTHFLGVCAYFTPCSSTSYYLVVNLFGLWFFLTIFQHSVILHHFISEFFYSCRWHPHFLCSVGWPVCILNGFLAFSCFRGMLYPPIKALAGLIILFPRVGGFNRTSWLTLTTESNQPKIWVCDRCIKRLQFPYMFASVSDGFIMSSWTFHFCLGLYLCPGWSDWWSQSCHWCCS